MENGNVTDNPITITVHVTTVLERMDIPYFIGGSLASIYYGMVRTTQDADLVALLEMKHVTSFVQSLNDVFYIDKEMIKGAIVHHGSFNIIHRESMFKVDVFIPVLRAFERSQIARADERILSEKPTVKARLASAEDVLLAKLEWYRNGGEVSERQWRDVIGILKVQESNLDEVYLYRYADLLGITDLLERAFQG